MDVQDHSHITPLAVASMRGWTDGVRLLLDSGAELDRPTEHGKTALLFAAEWGYPEVARLLVERGANINALAQGGLHCLYLYLETVAMEEWRVAQQPQQQEASASEPSDSTEESESGSLPDESAGPGQPESPPQSEPAQALRTLLELGASVAAASELWPTPLDRLLRLGYENEEEGLLPPAACAPELIRWAGGWVGGRAGGREGCACSAVPHV